MAFSEVFALDVVQKNSLQVYQIELSNWGNVGLGPTPNDPNSLVSPRIRTAIAGIAIDPQSNVDQVIIRASRNNVINSAVGIQPADLVLNKEMALLGRYNFPILGEYDGGWGLVARLAGRWHNYISLDGSTIANIDKGSRFEQPKLSVLVYVDAGAPVPMVPGRTISFFSRSADVTDVEATAIMVPVGGRKRIRVVGSPQGAVAGKLVSVRGITAPTKIGLLNPELGMEFEYGTFTIGAPGPLANQSLVITDPVAEYLHVVTSGANGSTNRIEVTVED